MKIKTKMVNSIEEEIFRIIDNLQRQFTALKEKTEKSLDNSAILHRWATKIERRVTLMSVRVKKIIERIDRVIKILDKEK